MSQSASQAAAFYRDVAEHRVVWTLKDEGGFAAPKGADGVRVMPFWSTRSRVERVIASVPAYAGFEPHEIPWEEFASDWAPGLAGDGLLVGVNWSGPRATGYDIEPLTVKAYVEAHIAK